MTTLVPSVMPRIGLGTIRRGLTQSVSLRLGFGLLLALVLLSIVGSTLLADPNEQSLADAYAPPGSAGHPFGTDFVGRDILAWTAGGIRTALLVSLCVVVLSSVVGVAVGLASGYSGGVVDAVAMRIADFQLALPPLLIFIAASAVLQGGIVSLVLLISAVSWVPYARLVRARILVERERAYIAAARLAGATRRRILFVHLLRSVVTVALVQASLQVGYVLLWESSLSFLGLGIQPPSTSLGYMVAEGRTSLVEAWWVAALPGLTIVLLIVSTNLIADGLRDVFHEDVEILVT